MTLRLTYELGC